jgi:hypothetical protein
MTKRALGSTRLADIAQLAFPSFVKSFVPKLIRSRVYGSADELSAEARGLEPETELIASEVVSFTVEARAWLLDGQVLSIACYEGEADLVGACSVAAEAAVGAVVPSPCVLDLGLLDDLGWAVIEANAAWGAGLNGCDPTAAAACIANATRARCA